MIPDPLALLSTAERERIPSFLVIGAQKAGTTWLDRNLRHHPDVFIPERKEVHFLDKHFEEGLTYYLSQFEGAGSKIAGELTPDYMWVGIDRIRWVHTLNPWMRLVLLLRDPVDRAWSAARYYLRNKRNQDVSEIDDAELQQLMSAGFMVRRGQYARAIRRWCQVFDSKQLMIGFYEDVQSRPEQLLLEVFAHIGANTDVELEGYPMREFYNKGPEADIPPQHREFLANLFAEELEILAKRFGGHAEAWRRRHTELNQAATSASQDLSTGAGEGPVAGEAPKAEQADEGLAV